jgi:hypothetical protein
MDQRGLYFLYEEYSRGFGVVRVEERGGGGDWGRFG